MSSAVRWASAALAALTLSSHPSAATERAAWVISQNDGSVTRVNLDSGAVTPNVATVGFLANRIEVNATGTWAVVACSGSDDVHVLDLATANDTAIALPAGSNPWDVEIVGARVFVTSLLHDRVYVVDVPTRAIVADVAVGKAPEGMCVAGGALWVANTGFDFTTFDWEPGTVTALDPLTLGILATVPVHLNPQECVAASNGSVHVVCTGDVGAQLGHVDVIDATSASVTASLSVPGYPGTGTVAPGVSTIYLGVTTTSFGSEVLSYDACGLIWIRGHDDPLLPTFDFYGNLRASDHGELITTDFPADLLLVETPQAPGSPDAFLVGDGPIDLALVKGDPPAPTAVQAVAASGTRLAIRAIAPNPSRGVARIAYFVPIAGTGRLEIFDVSGRRVLTRELGNVAPGVGSLSWNGRGNDGAVVAPGLFLVRLSVGDASATERLLRLR